MAILPHYVSFAGTFITWAISLLSRPDLSILAEPSLRLELTPIFNATHHATSLSSTLIIKNVPDVEVGSALLQMLTIYGQAPSNDYSGNRSLGLTDDNGELPVYFLDDGETDMRSWYANRTTKGSITVKFEAIPTIVDEHTRVAARVDLREDQGGLLGTGKSFIPVPPNSDTIYAIDVAWKLSADAPTGTKTVWTFGDGLKAHKRGKVDTLTGTNYMIGPINSHYRKVTTSIGVEEEFGVYWFGEPPTFNITDVAAQCEKMFIPVAGFFRDTDVSYKIFFRFNPVRGYGGTGMLRSFVLEYDLLTEPSEWEVLNLLTHEMIHNWPLMSGLSKEAIEKEGFYDEGVANLYAITLPFRFNIISSETFLEAMNNQASAYFTNPRIHLSNSESSKQFWTDFEAGRILYSRGFMYLFALDTQIRKASNGTRSLDDPMLELLRRKNEGEPYALEDWLALLVEELGWGALDDYNAMARGDIIVPSPEWLGPDFKLVREDQYIFELGFAESSIRTRVVSGVVAGTRAAEAGLRDEDIIIEHNSLWDAADNYGLNLTIAIERDGKSVEISFWPHGWQKVETWQWKMRDRAEDGGFLRIQS